MIRVSRNIQIFDESRIFQSTVHILERIDDNTRPVIRPNWLFGQKESRETRERGLRRRINRETNGYRRWWCVIRRICRVASREWRKRCPRAPGSAREGGGTGGEAVQTRRVVSHGGSKRESEVLKHSNDKQQGVAFPSGCRSSVR